MAREKKILDADDVTWSVASPEKWTHLVIYRERRKRDWRWLWLRKKTVTNIYTREWNCDAL